MESKRQQKFAGVIQKDLAEIFQREGMNFLPNIMVTITKVRVSPDLAIARVYLSFFNSTNNHFAAIIFPMLCMIHIIQYWDTKKTINAQKPILPFRLFALVYFR